MEQSIRYDSMVKIGFTLGSLLILAGIIGVFLGRMYSFPEIELTLSFYSLGIGTILDFISIFIFGIFLPLTQT